MKSFVGRGRMRHASTTVGSAVVVADTTGPSSNGTLADRLAADSRGRAVYLVDPVADLAEVTGYVQLPDLAEEYARHVSDLESDHLVLVGHCSAAQLTLEIARRLTGRGELTTIIANPQWITTDSVLWQYRKLERTISKDAEDDWPEYEPPPADFVNTLADRLAGSLRLSMARQCLPAEDAVAVVEMLVPRYRAWLGLLVASAVAGPPPVVEYHVVAAASELGGGHGTAAAMMSSVAGTDDEDLVRLHAEVLALLPGA